MKISGLTAYLAALMLLCSPLTAQRTRHVSVINANPKTFVQEFYNWYVAEAFNGGSGEGWFLVLKQRSNDLNPRLYRALKGDADAQAQSQGMIVGIDFDPFLNSQDPCERYIVGTVSKQRNVYSANVYGICSGEKGHTPDIVAEVMRNGQRWQFVNFLYPNINSDLLGILQLQSQDRKRSRN